MPAVRPVRSENISAKNKLEWDNDTAITSNFDDDAHHSEDRSSNHLVNVTSIAPISQAQPPTGPRIDLTTVTVQRPFNSRPDSANFHPLRTFQAVNKPSHQKKTDRHINKNNTAREVRNWARPEGLVTARLASYRQSSASEKAEKQKYLDPPDNQEEFPGLGCYLWPFWYENPTILLGPRLEDLNQIRLENRVWIEWDEGSKCINISTRSTKAAAEVVQNAIKEIQDVIKHAKAARVTASPLHIVHPPNSAVMTTLIKPKVIEKNPLRAKNLELKGEKLKGKERFNWKKRMNSKLNANIQLLREHLIRNLMVYAPVKHWMRLRVHFGNIVMNQFTDEFATTGSSWQSFREMLAAPRFSAAIDRNLGDAKLALNLKKNIVNQPEIFSSVNGVIRLEEAQFMDTEIIHFRTNNQLFRMEGEMDRSFDNPAQAYQMGSNSLYKDNRRNVLLEARTIDLEGDLDWKLELIADNKDEVISLPPGLRNLIKDSVPAQTKDREDALGLKFPDVAPKSSHFLSVSSVLVRSVIQYRMKKSGYIIEIAIYRQWEAATTAGNPDMFCSISMFHPDWDDETQELSSRPYGRAWKDDLSNFFKQSDQESGGIEYFLNQIRTIQGFIVQAKKELNEHDIKEAEKLAHCG